MPPKHKIQWHSVRFSVLPEADGPSLQDTMKRPQACFIGRPDGQIIEPFEGVVCSESASYDVGQTVNWVRSVPLGLMIAMLSDPNRS
jgi:hypothetical protein